MVLKCNNKTKTILMGFDTIEINLLCFIFQVGYNFCDLGVTVILYLPDKTSIIEYTDPVLGRFLMNLRWVISYSL